MAITVTILDNLDLEVRADAGTRAGITETTRDFWGTLMDIFEPYWTNGSYYPFDAGDAKPWVGLTSAPCIAESLVTRDDGEREIIGRCWWYSNYQTNCPLEELCDAGRVVFAFGFDTTEEK